MTRFTCVFGSNGMAAASGGAASFAFPDRFALNCVSPHWTSQAAYGDSFTTSIPLFRQPVCSVTPAM